MTLNSDSPTSTSLVLGLQGAALFLVYAILRIKSRALSVRQEFSKLSHVSCPQKQATSLFSPDTSVVRDLMPQKEEGGCALGAEAHPLFQAYMFVAKLT